MSDLVPFGETSMQDIDIPIEDDNIHARFAHVMKTFRLEFGTTDLRSIALGFKLITYKKLTTLYDTDPSQVDVIINWILECKFWTILEALLDVKFNKNLSSESDIKNNDNNLNLNDICEYSSDTVISDLVISSDTELLEIFTCINSLSETFKLDFPTQLDDEYDTNIQTTKWLNTLNKLNSFNKDSNLVKALDVDAPLRTSLSIDQTDEHSDEVFFKRAFKLLISNELEELNTLCQLTNNWDFALMVASLNDRIDPVVDLNDYSSNTIPSGVKSKILRKRTIYQLANNENIPKYERACYGLLSSDYITTNDSAENWEEKLYLYLNNLLNDKLDHKILNIFKSLGMKPEFSLLYKLSKPPVASSSVNDILNKLSNDNNQIVKEQSKHPIRVLIGSVISNNVKTLMDNTVKLLDSLLSNEDTIDTEITNESYLLRILTHLAIVLQLIYGEEIINNEDYTKLLKYYILRLILYKSYELIPTYFSFIPTNEQIIEIYSSFLFQFEYSVKDRTNQINGMRVLGLPLEDILRKTTERAFSETMKYYPTNTEIHLKYEVNEIDIKLYSTIFWFIDSGMTTEAVDASIILLRRFLLFGKIGSAIDYLKSFSLPKLIDDYRLQTSIITGIPNTDNFDIQILPSYKIHELTQYHNLFSTFQKLMGYNSEQTSFEELTSVIESLDKLAKNWLFDLVSTDSDDEIEEGDVEVYKELRRIYIPTIFNALFDILIENRSQTVKFVQKAMDLVNVLADEKFKLYEILKSTNELKPFLNKLANVSCHLYGEYEDGIYV
jgi:nuclear pore complex protein Nup107